MIMGVGDGSGQLFVHGDYDSIKAAQRIVIERDALRAENEQLRNDLDMTQAVGRASQIEIDSLRAENEQLRALLQKTVDFLDYVRLAIRAKDALEK